MRADRCACFSVRVGPRGERCNEHHCRERLVLAPNVRYLWSNFAARSLPDPDTGSPEPVPSIDVQYFDPSGTGPQRVRLERVEGAGKSHVTWTYLDGLGRTFATLTQADKLAGDGGQWVASGLPRLSAEGSIIGYFDPWFSDSDPANTPQLPPGAKVATVTLDSFGRAKQIQRVDGSLAVKYTYHPLSVNAEVGAGHWSSGSVDGHGRLIESVRRNDSDELRVLMTYQVGGEPARIVQMPPASASGASPVVRWMQYELNGSTSVERRAKHLGKFLG